MSVHMHMTTFTLYDYGKWPDTEDEVSALPVVCWTSVLIPVLPWISPSEPASLTESKHCRGVVLIETVIPV